MAAAVVDGRGRIQAQAVAPTPVSDDAEVVFESVCAAIGRVGHREDVAVCGVGCGGPMSAGGETVSPLNIASVAWIPACGAGCSRCSGYRSSSTTTPRRWLWAKDGWGRLGASRTMSPWWCPPGSGEASWSTAGCSTAPTGMPDTSVTWWSSRTGDVVRVGVGAVSRPRRRVFRSRRRPGVRPSVASTAIRRRTGTLVGRAVATVANLLDLELAVVAGSVALGFGQPFFAAAQEEIELRARSGVLAADPDHPGRTGTGRHPWWGRRRWAAGPWRVCRVQDERPVGAR